MNSIIDAARNQGKNVHGIPRVTSVDKEKNKGRNKTFKAKLFMIVDEETASEYAMFMDSLIKGSSEMLREESTWNQHGELLKFVEFMESDD